MKKAENSGKIKEMKTAEYIRNKIIKNGPVWKENKLEIHLNKRKRLGHIPDNWTAEDYNLKIIDILEDVNLEFYKYYMDGFDQVYYVFGLPNWVVIVGENGIMETAFEVDRKSYNDYLNLEDGILV